MADQFLLYAGPVAATDTHAHHAYQLTIAIEGELRLSDGGAARACRAALIPPDRRHAFAAPAGSVLILYIQPERRWGQLLRPASRSLETLSDWIAEAAPLRARAPASLPRTWPDVERIAATLRPKAAAGAGQRHPAVERALAYVAGALTDGDVRLPAVAAASRLSPGRLAHVFTDTVGIPLRPYVLWLRLMAAARAVARGGTLTDAAHEAGFSDSAHLSRVFRRMFGISPSDITRGVQWVTAPGDIAGGG